MEINRLTITTESRILGDEYVRFGGEYIETCFHKGKQGALCLAISNTLCSAYGESPEEAYENLEQVVDDWFGEMYLIDDFA